MIGAGFFSFLQLFLVMSSKFDLSLYLNDLDTG